MGTGNYESALFYLLSSSAASGKNYCETRPSLLPFMKGLHFKGADAVINREKEKNPVLCVPAKFT